MAGIDVRVRELSNSIFEVLTSYEIDLDGKTLPIKSIGNLTGHNIEPFKIHGKKNIPNINYPTKHIMEEGEIYAIETYASTGTGWVFPQEHCSHYMKKIMTCRGYLFGFKVVRSFSHM